jgi:hypothetical protein
MDSEIVDVVTDWESQSFSGGIDGLRGLADEEFTGAVTEGTGWLFFLNGRVVGVFDGDLDRFEGASGTAHRAPDPSLPLLFTMLATGGETKAQYYTEDTSLSSADDTLSAGNFTGYVELSENVLSGDYYVVYYGGRKLPCAFLGQNREVVTGEEAFDRAADEVGIYEVMDVDVEITELPEPDEPDSSGADGTVETGGTEAGSGDDPPTDTADEGTRPTDASSGGASPADTTGGGSQPADAAGGEAPTADTASTGGESSARGSVTTESSGDPHGADRDEETATAEGQASADAAGRRRGAASSTATEPAGSESQGAGGRETGSSASAPSRPTDGGAAAAQSDAGGEIEPGAEPPDPEIASEREWQETRTIPSLDPSESSTDGTPNESADDGGASVAVGDGRSEQTDGRASGANGDRRTASSGGQRTASGSGQRTASSSDRRTASSDSRQSTTGRHAARSEGRRDGESRAGRRDESSEKLAALREQVTEVETQRDEAQAELQETREQLERREEELTDVRAEREELSERVEELEAERDELREQLAEFEAQQPDGDRELASGPALSGTNLFVRYDSKSEPTLETAHAETATRAEVEENLRLETHTEFDQSAVVVEGEAYEEFLSDTVEYNFVQWVVRELLYELQETGAEGKLRDLYDAIPKIDRAELHGVVELVGEDQKIEGERPFDVILRDRMGEPLVVANVADTREATAEPAVSELIGDAREVAESRDSLGCATYVSASFFEPRALEAVTEETGGGLLSRNKRASYVKLARKRGFHLGLVESREEGFHFTVPEL